MEDVNAALVGLCVGVAPLASFAPLAPTLKKGNPIKRHAPPTKSRFASTREENEASVSVACANDASPPF